jgi:hypothetical protein
MRAGRAAEAAGRLFDSRDAVAALATVAAGAAVSPPRISGLLSVVMAVLLAVLVAGGLHMARRLGAPGRPLATAGAWARATVALGFSASVVMMFSATVAVLG